MARIDKNDLTLGLRGKFGDQFLFGKYRNRTIALRHFGPGGVTTEAQRQQRGKFRLAIMPGSSGYCYVTTLMPTGIKI